MKVLASSQGGTGLQQVDAPDGANACHTSSKQQDFFAQSEHVGHGVSCNPCQAAHLVDELEGGES